MSSSAENLDLNMAPNKGFDLNDAPMADEEVEAEAESEEETEKEEEEEKKEAKEGIEEDDTEMYIRSQGTSQYTDNINGKDHHHQFGASLSFSFRKVESVSSPFLFIFSTSHHTPSVFFPILYKNCEPRIPIKQDGCFSSL